MSKVKFGDIKKRAMLELIVVTEQGVLGDEDALLDDGS